MRFKPLKIFLLYISLTIIISFWGPTIYENYNKFIVGIYMLFFMVIFSVGYLLGINRIERKRNGFVEFYPHSIVLKIVKIVIAFTISLQMIEVLAHIATNGFQLKSVGNAYLDVYSNYTRNSGRSYSVIELLGFILGIFEFISITLGIFYFNKLSRKWKFLLILVIMTLIFSSLGLQGKQKQLGDLVVISFSLALLKLKNVKVKKKIVAGVLIGTIGVFFAFVAVQKSRFDAIGINLFNYNSLAQSQIVMNENHFIFDIFGYEWGFPISLLLSGYLSGGYYGLSLSLQLPFYWTFGLGSSYVFAVLSQRILGLPFYFNEGYVFRMEEMFGWPALSKWHTIFPWLASDFTFAGTLLIFGIIAYLYAISWIEAQKYNNPISVLMFTLLNILLIYVPANNQLFMGIEQFFLAIIIIFVWINRHRIFKKKH